jgi:hypothetical protein
MNARIFLPLILITFAPLVARAEVAVQVQPTA